MHLVLSPDKRSVAIQAKTMVEAIESQTGCLALVNQFDRATCRSILVILLNDVIDFLNVGKSMDAAQLVQTVDLIIADPVTKNLKPEDLKVCFDNAKKGQYGKSYDRIDGQIIFEWLNTYANQRMELIEDLNTKKHLLEKKGVISGEVNPEGQKKVLEILRAAQTELGEIEFSQNLISPEPIQKDEKTILIQKFFTEFDGLFKNHPINQAGKRYVNFKGKTVDQVEYAEIRLNEKN